MNPAAMPLATSTSAMGPYNTGESPEGVAQGPRDDMAGVTLLWWLIFVVSFIGFRTTHLQVGLYVSREA